MKTHSPKTLVLCEGKEDRLVMQGLADHAELTGSLVFEDYGGESNLRAYLANLKVSPGYARGEFRKILVTRDADSSFESAWQSVSDAIKDSFSIVITEPGKWLVNADSVPFAAWVIPGPGRSGMIETLCLDAARMASPDMFGCIDPFMECLRALHGEAPHEKIRFALWTIVAQGKTAQDRLSMERVIRRIPIAWEDDVFNELREILRGVSS